MEYPLTDPKHFGLLRALDQFAHSAGVNINDKDALDKFIEHLTDAANEHQKNNALIHGLRIQTMFAYFAAALDGCTIITEEDAGDFFAESSNLKRPDFRILTKKNKELFVEVKNFNQSDPLEPYILHSEYAHKLRGYAATFGKPLLFAIYWRKWGIWTLNQLDSFKYDGRQYSLLLTETAKNDQKSILGDRLIGITKPLGFRIYTDSVHPRKIDQDGHAQFTIKRVALLAGGKEIEDATERRLAWFFFLYGSWQDLEQPAHVENGELLWVDMEPVKEDPNPNELFMMIGSLSEMISRQFNSMTSEQGAITHLAPGMNPSEFGVKIPEDYKNKVFGIWRFDLRPDNEIFP
jgi:hypothetical protein